MKQLVQVMIFLLSINLIGGCSKGWSVGNLQVTPSDTMVNTVFIEIMAIDSVMHYYHHTIYETQNWCWLHHEFEDVKLVDE